MYYQFATEKIEHAKAALLLYAMYRSRDSSSPLNGLETWERFQSFVRGACLKSSTTAGFVQAFCAKAKIASIKPYYFNVENEPVMLSNGDLILSENIKNYRLEILEDDNILKLYNTESVYLILLVRERIQREKYERREELQNDKNDML